MKFYAYGKRPDPALVTLETVSEDLTFKDDIYVPTLLNVCKVIKITDPSEKILYSWAEITIGDEHFKIAPNQYVYVKDGPGLNSYYNKLPVLEMMEPSSTFTGVKFTHYRNGSVHTKTCYMDGKILKKYYHRDDLFNSIEKFTFYHKGKEELEYHYDEFERPMMQVWLTPNGKTYWSQPLN
jgi:hypothetical protein